ncbi:MAG: MgtC/SapB family protein [Candidatus Eiseniibacteriota bacterium]
MIIDPQVGKLLLSVVLGAVIGFERFMDGKAAGLRTHTLVCLGSAAFVVASENVRQRLGVPDLDPMRVAAGVVTGIGFLGAGSIIRSGGSVHGLTTAATIWVVSAIGVAVGVGSTELALWLTGLAFVVLQGFRWIEVWFGRKTPRTELERKMAEIPGPRRRATDKPGAGAEGGSEDV